MSFRFACGLVVVPVALFCGLLSLAKLQSPTDGLVLGSEVYDVRKAEAPVATGIVLKILSSIITNPIIGPTICRILINDNGIHEVRELASQVEEAAVYWPIVRISRETHKEHEQQAAFPKAPVHTNSGSGYWGVQDFNAHYSEGRGTPTEVIRQVIEDAATIQKSNRIFIEMLEDTALEEAAASSIRWKNGKPISVFDGVPFAVKDECNVKDTVLGEGSIRLPGAAKAKSDDIMVARLRAAGAILIGKTMMHEYGAQPTGFNAHFGGPVNPYNGGYYPGGSSSGSGAAVAYGLVPVALGFDGGGSIRIPAACNGVFGMSATFTRIPTDTLATTAMSVLHGGPIAADAASLALAYQVLAQPPGEQHIYSNAYGSAVRPPPPHLHGFNDVDSLEGIRLGIYWPYFEDAEASVVSACKKAVQSLERLGAKVVNITIPHIQAMTMAHGLTILSEMAQMHDQDWHKGQPFQADTAIQHAIGRSFTGMELVSAARLRGWAMKWMEREVFTRVDAVVTPTLASLPPVLTEAAKQYGESNVAENVKLLRFIFLGNFLGNPGVTAPVGYDNKTNLPIGLHFLGDHWKEAPLLRLANALNQRHLLERRKPAAHTNVLRS